MSIIARQATANFALTYVGMALGFLNVAVLYPRLLPDDEFGLTRLLVSIATALGTFSALGLDNAVVRYFPYFKDRGHRHMGFMTMVLALGFAGALISVLGLVVFHGTLSSVFSDRSALYGSYGLLAVPMVLAEVFFLLLRSYSRSVGSNVFPTFLREVMLRALQAALILAHWRLHLPFSWFVLLFSGTFFVCTAFLLARLVVSGRLSHRPGALNAPKRLVRSMVTYGWYSITTSMSSVVLGSIDQIMIGALLGTDALKHVAYYSVAFFFGSVISAPARAISQPAVPALAEAWKARDIPRIQRIYASSSAASFTIGAFVALLVYMNLDELFSLLPPGYSVARPVVIIIGAANLISMAAGLNGGIITMSRAYRFDAAANLLVLMCTVLFDLAFIIAWGIEGAAWSTLVSYVIVLAMKVGFLYRRFGLYPFQARMLWLVPLCVLISYAAGLLGLLSGFSGHGWYWTVGTIVVKCLLVAVLFWPPVLLLKLAPPVNAILAQRFGARNGSG